MILLDNAEAKEIVELLKISKPSVYESLRSLEDKGLVILINNKPAVYQAISPKMAVDILLDIHKKASADAYEELSVLEP